MATGWKNSFLAKDGRGLSLDEVAQRIEALEGAELDAALVDLLAITPKEQRHMKVLIGPEERERRRRERVE